MWVGIIALSVGILLVILSRYHEIPKDSRPSFLRWLRGKRSSDECSYRPDETAKRFAEQWSAHPTLSQRQADAIKRSLRKKKKRG